MEGLFQNKWQNGLCCPDEGCVYAIPLGAATLLRIRTGRGGEGGVLDEPEVTTWALPEPRKTLEKVSRRRNLCCCLLKAHRQSLITPHKSSSRAASWPQTG